MKKNLGIKVLVFLSGLSLLGLGINLMLTCTDLGLSPWDALFYSLYENFGWTIGTWMLISNFAMALVVYIDDKKQVNLGTIIMIVLISVFVDGIGWLALDALQNVPNIVAFILGNICVGVGIGLYVSTQLMVAPHELFMMMLTKRLDITYRKAEIYGSIGAVVCSLLLGGAIYVGTALLIFTTGYIIQFVMERSKSKLNQLDEKWQGA